MKAWMTPKEKNLVKETLYWSKSNEVIDKESIKNDKIDRLGTNEILEIAFFVIVFIINASGVLNTGNQKKVM